MNVIIKIQPICKTLRYSNVNYSHLEIYYDKNSL